MRRVVVAGALALSTVTLAAQEGGGPSGGAVYSLAIAPANPAILYASFGRGGMIASRDGGRTWTPADNDPVGLCELAADPNLAATAYAVCHDGVYRTTDAGRAWTQVVRAFGSMRIRVAPSDSRTLYVFGPGLAVSRNAGAEWEMLAEDLFAEDDVEALEVDPADASIIYVGTSGRVLKSLDAGRTFAPLGTGLPADADVLSVALDTQNPGVVYAGTDRAGVFRAPTAGGLWSPVGDGSLEGSVSAIVVAPGASDVLYARGGDVIYRSRDAGGHWTAIHRDLEVVTGDTPVIVSPTSPAGAYVLARGELQHTRDGGAHWTPAMPGVSRTTIHRLAFEGGARPALLAYTTTGVSVSYDSGRTWARFATRGAVDAERDVKIKVSTPLDGHLFGAASLAVSPHDPRSLVVGGRCLPGSCSVWRSADGGTSWEQAFSTAEYSMPTLLPTWDPADPKTIYVLVDNIGVGGGGGIAHKSADGGATWSELPLQGLIYFFTVLPTRPSTIFAQTPDFSGRGHYALYRSTDAGRTWTDSQDGLPRDETVSAMTVDPRDPRRLYAAVDTRGLFVSADGGASWISTAAR